MNLVDVEPYLGFKMNGSPPKKGPKIAIPCSMGFLAWISGGHQEHKALADCVSQTLVLADFVPLFIAQYGSQVQPGASQGKKRRRVDLS